MGSMKIAVAAGLVSLAAGAAQAADLPPPPVLEPAGRPDFVEIGSGWYLRGDVGYAIPVAPKASYAGIPLAGEKLDKSGSVGGGFGYKFTNWLRADVTGDYYWSRDFRAVTPVAGGGTWNDRGDLQSWAVMANGYVDLGNWSGFTPYVGAGIGIAGNELKKAAVDVYTSGGALAVTTLYGNDRRYNFAWALMAGTAIDVTSELKLDIGYRYMNLGEARTLSDAAGGIVRLKDLQQHEIRFGLRYLIDG
ncbi:porin family protein [Chelatococcus sp. SYSU_G07232]|uniref:Porin family protein n=1 Tax=Chelatococcus albus TaxID=3047466 RepID=A0ABT7AFT5_9HYPH|nr:outer membrane protein [Chelatococcus sp. SYSU_G07232]MDJ1158233.1 porin family protein [Chelatococcus sp. SYSU_G07232]